MSDLTLTTEAESDLTVAFNDIKVDDGLEGAVLLSLFCDRRAAPGDALPPGETDRRGWWGDEFTDGTDKQIGSRLWLLGGKVSQSSLLQAERYSREALAWMVTDRAARSVEVTASQVDGQIVLEVSITRPNGADTRYRYGLLWDAKEQTLGL